MQFQNTVYRCLFDRFRQTLSRRHCGVLVALLTFGLLVSSVAHGQLIDSLDAFPPRWQLESSDCQARITRHANEPTSGVGGSGCESISLRGGHGTQTLLTYRIEPSRVMDALTAHVFVKSTQAGPTIGLRVRFPLVSDPATGQSLATIIWGTGYRDTGTWQKLGVNGIERQLRLKTYALRRQLGPGANLDASFVDAVVINAYTGPGESTLLVDHVIVDGMLPLHRSSASAGGSLDAQGASPQNASSRDDSQVVTRSVAATDTPAWEAPSIPAFPAGQVTRILQHRGEPLPWVRTLGFDAILINTPATAAVLSEAGRVGLKVYCPPPTAPDPALTSLLEPLAGYYLGTSLGRGDTDQVRQVINRVQAWPALWQRPFVLAPAEAFRSYGDLVDTLILDLPPAIRGLGADEEIATLGERQAAAGKSQLDGVGVQTEVPESLRMQLDEITQSVGAPRGEDLYWHSVWLQVTRALEASPRAILFRSSRALTSGSAEAQHRSLALSYINRFLDAVGPLAATGRPLPALTSSGPAYHLSRLDSPAGQLILLSTRVQQQGQLLAGDGRSLRVMLPAGDSGQIAWRLTHFVAERLTVERDASGTYLEILSPDVVETIVLSSDPTTGGRLARQLRPLASQAASDRWQLTREAAQRVGEAWQLATSARVVPVSTSASDLLRAAETTLRDAEPLLRADDPGATLHMARRADAWTLKARWQLVQAMEERLSEAAIRNSPPLMTAGGIPAQVIWWPLMEQAGWSDNLLLGGSLDSQTLMGQAGWKVGTRPDVPSHVHSQVEITAGPQIEGSGCLVASVSSVSNQLLPGGYAGTMLQICSPTIRFQPKTAIRIDVKIKTLGFGGPDQGVLVYDSIAGAELGSLVRATPQWQTVTLLRQTLSDGPMQVNFELIGAGEVAIDDVQVRRWTGTAQTPLPLQRLGQNQIAEPTTR